MNLIFKRKKNTGRTGRRSSRRLQAEDASKGSPNILLLVIFIGILLFGLFMVFDASYFLEGWDRITKQLIWVALGAVASLFFYLIDYRRLQTVALPLFAVTVVFILWALIGGVEINGATNWIILPGGIQFQPGELAKFSVVLVLATVLTFFREKLKIKKKEDLIGTKLLEFIAFFVGLGILALLLVIGRDLGNAMIVGIVALTVFFVSGTTYVHSLGTFLIIMIYAGLGVLATVIAPYRAARLQVFLDLLLKGEIGDPRGAGYQISQILIGIGGTGGPDGTGFGRSRQRLGFLVEDTAFTDSIGAVVLEELGFYKALIFIAVYVFMLYLCFQIALKAPDRFGQLLAAGLSISLAVQFFIHMGANLALIPLTGVTLPFISYGGSSIVISMISMAILLNISRFSGYEEK